MKQTYKRIISFLLSICIIVVSVFLCPVSSYAVYDPGTSWWDKFLEESSTYLVYLASRVGAVVDHDFAQWWQTREDYIDWWNTGHISRLENSDGDISYSFDADLVAQIKQALIEYANETNGFKLEQTYPVNAIPASTFPSKPAYEAFKSYCAAHYYSMASPYSNYMYIGDLTPYIKDGGGFVRSGSQIVVYNSNWKIQGIPMNYYQFLNDENGDPYVKIIENQANSQSFSHYDPNKKVFNAYGQGHFLVTKDGGRIRVFNSASEFMNYDAGQRKVYFGSGFYDFDPSDITATWDDINDKIGHMDDIMQDILDAITDNPNLSEEDLEKLIDELIGKIGEIGGQIGDKTDQTNTILGGISSTLSGISSSLSGYFSSVLSYLSGLVGTVREGFMTLSGKLDMMIYELGLIYESMGDMTEEEVSEKTDSLLSQLFSAFSEIGDVLKRKFPFCLPNDLYTMLALLAGNEVSVSPGAGGGGGGDGNGDIMICAYGTGNEDSKAPVFEIPFVIGSADIEEKIIIDLSPFEYISKLSRTLMTLYFCACLMQLTLKVIDLGKDLGDD